MTKPILTDIEAMEQIIQARHWDPFSILGPHKLGQNPLNCETVIRALLPTANRVWIVSDNLERSEMGRIGVDGFFEIGLKVAPSFPYRFQVEGTDGHTWEQIDPYQFQPVLGELDFHLVREGTHERLYDKLGAHLVNHQGVAGVTFAVWAPNAERVSVIGDFNRWDGRQNLMRVREQSGVWELFIPGWGSLQVRNQNPRRPNLDQSRPHRISGRSAPADSFDRCRSFRNRMVGQRLDGASCPASGA